MNFQKIILFLLIFFQVLPISSQTLWCPKSGIDGFEEEAHKAKTVLRSTTSSLQKMEVYTTVKGDQLYIQSNYAHEGMAYPLKIATNEETYEMKNWLKYLIDPDSYQEVNEAFDKAYENNIIIYVDASVFSHPRYKNLVWDEAKNVKIVDGSDIISTELFPYINQRVVKVRENTYIALQPEEACEVAGQLSKIKDVVDKLAEDNSGLIMVN
jgi:hypothetical protein